MTDNQVLQLSRLAHQLIDDLEGFGITVPSTKYDQAVQLVADSFESAAAIINERSPLRPSPTNE